MTDTPNALRSLWGYGDRPQEVLTPLDILTPLRELWGDIAFDPFGSRQHLFAQHTALLPDDGQRYVWPDRTFGNPAYAMLDRALNGSATSYPDAWDEEGKVTHRTKLGPASYYLMHPDGLEKRWCFLIPVRPHRRWWRSAANAPHILTLELDPITFVGFSQSFPAPLCLMFTNERRSAVESVFGHLGDVRGTLLT